MTDEIKVPEGHGMDCYFCHQYIDGLSGNPHLWPTKLIGDGAIRFWHVGCATKHINNLQAAIAAAYEDAAKIVETRAVVDSEGGTTVVARPEVFAALASAIRSRAKERST